ncbi:MAG: Cof-type HAD-IIB family hydrolase [Tumebacillaceae bacterium]
MIRLIVMDLDETLIAPDKQIPRENVEAIRRAREAGITIVLATARAWSRTEAIYRDLALDTPAIVSSGARLVDGVSGEEIWSRTIPLDFARDVATYSDEYKIPLRVYVGHEVWNNLSYDPAFHNQISYGKHVRNIPNHLAEEPYQIYTKGHREVELLTKRFGLSGDGFVSNVMTYYDGIPEVCILNPQSTKGDAVAAVAADMGMARDEVMAIGDSRNDLSMMEWAGIGVAMGWSSDEVKERADLVTSEGNPAGVAEAINQILGKTRAVI